MNPETFTHALWNVKITRICIIMFKLRPKKHVSQVTDNFLKWDTMLENDFILLKKYMVIIGKHMRTREIPWKRPEYANTIKGPGQKFSIVE